MMPMKHWISYIFTFLLGRSAALLNLVDKAFFSHECYFEKALARVKNISTQPGESADGDVNTSSAVWFACLHKLISELCKAITNTHQMPFRFYITKHFHWCVCRILEWWEHVSSQSRCFETLRDLAIKSLTLSEWMYRILCQRYR